MTKQNIIFTLVLLLTFGAMNLNGQEVPPPPVPIENTQIDLLNDADFIESLRKDDAEWIYNALQAGQDANVESPSGHNALSIAAIEDRPHLIKLLLDHGADVDRVSHSASALIYATSLNQSRCVEELLNAGADPRVTSTDGKTALHYAALKGHTELIEKLLDFGALPDARDGEGNTPLMLAIQKQDLDGVRLLLNRGADRTQRNLMGKDAASIASALEATEIELALSQNTTSQMSATQTNDDQNEPKPIQNGKDLVKALADALPGDVLQLEPRTYDGEFVITKSRVTILGDPNGGTVMRNSKGKQEFILYIRDGANLSLQNVQLAFDGPNQVGLYSDGSEVELRDCQFNQATHHACFGVDSQLRLSNCHFDNLMNIGLFARGKSSVSASQCVFENGKRTAVQLESGASGELENCQFNSMESASVLAIEALRLTINQCRFDRTNQAISVNKLSSELCVLGCQFENCKTSVLATDVQGMARLIGCDFRQAAESQAIYIENGQTTLIARNQVLGGDVAFNIQGRFDTPVAIAGNHAVGTVKGAVFVQAQSAHDGVAPIRFSRNSILSETGYGVLLEATSPAVFAQNRILVNQKMAVSLQRGSAAVFNTNYLFSNDLTINLFESDASASTFAREQFYGPTPTAVLESLKTDLSRRLSYVTEHAKSIGVIRNGASKLFQIAREGNVDGAKFKRAWADLESQFQSDEKLAKSLVPITFSIEDKAGNRQRSGFTLFESESSASGMSQFVASDLLDTTALLERLRNDDSLFGSLSKWARNQSALVTTSETESELLVELNRQLTDPSLYDASRFEQVVDVGFVDLLNQLGSLNNQKAETIRQVNRLLFEKVFPNLVASSRPIGTSDGRPLFVLPGRYWVVSNANPNLVKPVQLHSGNGTVIASLPRSLWLAVQPGNEQTRHWKLFQFRKQKEVKYELEHLRPRISTLKSVLRQEATNEQITRAHAMALQSLDIAILPLNDAKKVDPSLKDSTHFETSRYVRQILALTGNAVDARSIASQLKSVDDVIFQLLWLETVAHIESRIGILETGALMSLAKSTGDRELATAAAVQLHLQGINSADSVIRNYLQNANDLVLAERAAWTLLDDDQDQTRLAMLSFHNQLMLEMEKDPWERWKTIPTTLYLLSHGTASDLRYLSVTPMTTIHLKWMAPMMTDPLPAAQVLIDNRNFDGARDLATSLLSRQGGEVYWNELTASILMKMQSETQTQLQQMAMAYRGKKECDIYCSFGRPNETAAKMLGGFDDTENKFVDMRAKASFSIDMQSIVTWQADDKQLDQYVRNWQAGHNNYVEKFDYFTIDEIEASLKRIGGDEPAALELFKAKHEVATCQGMSQRDYFPYGMERRGYVLAQSMADEEYVGAINGLIEVKVEPCSVGTRVWLRHRQAGYFDQLGTLASKIDSHSKPEDWPIYRYLENDGEALIKAIHLRRGDQSFEVVGTGESKDGFRAFEVACSDPTEGEHYLDVVLNFFGQETTLTYALHNGEIGRSLRRQR